MWCPLLTWSLTYPSYDECLTDLLSSEPEGVRIVVASHNENSIRLAVKLLQEQRCSDHGQSNVSFAQLYGMADYMSFTLGKTRPNLLNTVRPRPIVIKYLLILGSLGYQVYKSVPYGTVDETLLYLSRRVKENCLVLTGIRKEMAMLKRGLGYRLSGRRVD